MANVKIRMIVYADDGGGIDKLIPATTPHGKKGGFFVWRIKNELERPIDVKIANVVPLAYLEFDDGSSIRIDEGATEQIRAHIVQKGPVKLTYDVYVGSTKIDPDLIIDGDSNVPPTGRKGGKKAAKKAKKKR